MPSDHLAAPDGEPKTVRFNMFLSPSESKAIDDWAWEQRIRSKSEAVRRLCAIGLQICAVNRHNSLDLHDFMVKFKLENGDQNDHRI